MANNSMFLSVIMCVFHENEIWLKQSIESILNQTYHNFEFIIILDDPLNKDLLYLLSYYKNLDNRIILVENHKNIGLTASLNKGLSIAKGDYIARMDSDDISLSNRFEKQLNLIKKNTAVVGCQCIVINEIGAEIRKTKFQINDKGIKFSVRYMLPSLSHPSVLINKRLLRNIGGYDENFVVAQDYNLWCRLFSQGIFINVAEPLLLLRKHDQNISKGKKILQAKNTIISNICLRKKIINPLTYNQYDNINLSLDNNNIYKKYIKMNHSDNNNFLLLRKIKNILLVVLSIIISQRTSGKLNMTN